MHPENKNTTKLKKCILCILSSLVIFIVFQFYSCQNPPTKFEYSSEFTETPKDSGEGETQQREESIEHMAETIDEDESKNYSSWSCEKIYKDFATAFLEERKESECEKDEDCTIVGSSGVPCSCIYAPRGVLSGVSIPKANTALIDLANKFFSDECYHVRKCQSHKRGNEVNVAKCNEKGYCYKAFKPGYDNYICE